MARGEAGCVTGRQKADQVRTQRDRSPSGGDSRKEAEPGCADVPTALPEPAWQAKGEEPGQLGEARAHVPVEQWLGGGQQPLQIGGQLRTRVVPSGCGQIAAH